MAQTLYVCMCVWVCVCGIWAILGMTKYKIYDWTTWNETYDSVNSMYYYQINKGITKVSLSIHTYIFIFNPNSWSTTTKRVKSVQHPKKYAKTQIELCKLFIWLLAKLVTSCQVKLLIACRILFWHFQLWPPKKCFNKFVIKSLVTKLGKYLKHLLHMKSQKNCWPKPMQIFVAAIEQFWQLNYTMQ